MDATAQARMAEMAEMVEMQPRIRSKPALLAVVLVETAAAAVAAAVTAMSQGTLLAVASTEDAAGAVTAAKDRRELRAAMVWCCLCINRQQQPKKGTDYGFYKHR